MHTMPQLLSLMNQSTWLTNQSFAWDIQSLSQYCHFNFNYLTFTVGFISSEPCTAHTGEWSNRISAHSLWHTCPFERALINICIGNTWKAGMYSAIKPILGNMSTSQCGDFLLTKYIDISMQTSNSTVNILKNTASTINQIPAETGNRTGLRLKNYTFNQI